MKGYVLDYINENEFKKLERALKKYNMLAFKKLNLGRISIKFLMGSKKNEIKVLNKTKLTKSKSPLLIKNKP